MQNSYKCRFLMYLCLNCWLVYIVFSLSHSPLGLQERAIATSGNYLRFREYGGERFGHLIDPRTGYPAATDCGAVSVVAPTCTEAGVLASCAVIMGSVAAPQWMASFNQATGALVTHRGVVRLPGFETIELGQKHASASGKE